MANKLHKVIFSHINCLEFTFSVIPDRRNCSAKMLPVLVSMDLTSLYTNIPREEGITIMCKAYEAFYRNEPPIPSQYLADMLRLILKENSFQFVRKKTTSKYKVRLWGQKWQLHLLTSLCLQ